MRTAFCSVTGKSRGLGKGAVGWTGRTATGVTLSVRASTVEATCGFAGAGFASLREATSKGNPGTYRGDAVDMAPGVAGFASGARAADRGSRPLAAAEGGATAVGKSERNIRMS